MMKASLVLMLLVPAVALRMHQRAEGEEPEEVDEVDKSLAERPHHHHHHHHNDEGAKEPEYTGPRIAPPASAHCPDISDQENVLFWGMILDGKDHMKGKHAYDWHGFEYAFKSLDLFLGTEADQPLSMDKLLRSRAAMTPKGEEHKYAFANKKCLNGKKALAPYTCLRCDHMEALLNDVPADLFVIQRGENPNQGRSPGSCPDYKEILFTPKDPPQIQAKFEQHLAAYNADIEMLTDNDAKLERLASFLKDVLFTHMFKDGNGRFHTFMMHHELRRLGIACGSFMYNNNHDHYYITKKVYVEKIKEGIDMYNQAMATGSSPWVDEANVAQHKARFAHDVVMPGFLNCGDGELHTGSVALKSKAIDDEGEDYPMWVE